MHQTDAVLAPASSPPARRGWTPSRAAGVFLLLVVTIIWGTTFVATNRLVAGPAAPMTPATVTFWRFLVAAVVFLPALLRGRGASAGSAFDPRLWRAGAELSFWLWAGYATQAIGLRHTSINRSAFVTSLNVVFVPVLLAACGRRVGWLVWAAVTVALAGAAVMTNDGSRPNAGDLWTLGCAFTYAMYIVRLERHAKAFDANRLTAVQLWGVAGLSLPWVLAEWGTGNSAADVSAGWSAGVVGLLLYMGVVATLATTWLQAVGQRVVPGTHASLLYTTEPVFAAAIVYLLHGEALGPRGWVGGAMILVAAAASQVVPAMSRRRRGPRGESA